MTVSYVINIYLCYMFYHRLPVKFFIPVNFCFPFVSNSLAYIIIPKSNGKIKIN